jgi:hypothetical protein
MLRPTDTFEYYPDGLESAPEPRPAVVCRYGSVAFWIDYAAKLEALWPDNGEADVPGLLGLACTVAVGTRNMGDGGLGDVLTLPQLLDFVQCVRHYARLSEAMRKKSERQSQSPGEPSAAAAATSA